MTQSQVVTAGVKRVSHAEVLAGGYDHLGITYTGGRLIVPSSIIPPDDMGRMSKANIHGYSQKRYDLPKITKTYTLNGKNYQGDDVENYYDRPVYQIDHHPPLGMEIEMKLVHQEQTESGVEYYFRFDVDRHLDRFSTDFDRQIKENLGFLRENTGITGIYPTGINDTSIMMITFSSWEFLPPGVAVDELVARAIGRATLTPEERTELESRLKLLHELQPGGGFVAGTRGLAGYIGARFGDNLTVLENRGLGNAIYLIYKDWPAFSKMTRTEIINSGRDTDFERIEHRGEWAERLQKIVQAKRSDI